MTRAIQLAKNGLGSTWPNPMVGCVIVHSDKIIGEGFTSYYGGNHAEVNAINSVKDKSLLKEAILYVSLEPCSHHGNTPPCADLIVKNEIPKVVIGCQDPHEKVAGKGIQKLRKAGCVVEVGILEAACREHHRRFLTFHEKKRPYIILKWAETADGFIAPDKKLRKNDPEPFWITNEKSRQLVHKWRAEEQAILIGTNTALEDDPRLNVRDWAGNSPIRIVIDRELKVPSDYKIFDGSVRTHILNENKNEINASKNLEHLKIDFKEKNARQICNVLFKKNIVSMIVEGGAKTLQAFIDEDLWDEARVFKGTHNFEKGLKAPVFSGKSIDEKKILTDSLTIYRND